MLRRRSFPGENPEVDLALTLRKEFVAPALLAAAAAAALYIVASASTLWDRDEPRFAQATVEMLRSGDYRVELVAVRGATSPPRSTLR